MNRKKCHKNKSQNKHEDKMNRNGRRFMVMIMALQNENKFQCLEGWAISNG